MGVTDARTPHILLVEDEAVIAMSEAQILEQAGFEVEPVHTGERAIERVGEDGSIDLVLMDIDLGPGIDGTEAATRILADQDLPVVFLTSHAEKEMVDRVKGITRYGYVLKDAGRFVLVESANMALELFRAHQETRSRERRIERLNRTYRVLSDVNQAIVQVRDTDALFEAICRIAVEKGDFLFAWIGVPEQDGHHLIPVASSVQEPEVFSESIADLLTPSQRDGPMSRAFRSGTRAIVNDINTDPCFGPWQETATARGVRSCAAFPVRARDEVKAVLSLYAPVTGFFDGEEVQLLDELVLDLEFAMEVKENDLRRQEAEHRRREWEELMRHIIRHDPSAIAVLDTDLRHVFVSDRFLEDYRVSETEVIGRGHYDVFPEIPEKWRQVHRRAMQGETLRSADDYFIRADGTVDYTRWECRPWYDLSGGIGGIVLYTEVLTKLRSIEQNRRTIRGALESLLRHSPDLVSMIDAEGRYWMISDSVAEAIGVEKEAIIGQRFQDVLPTAIAEDFESSIRRVTETGNSFTKTDSVPGADGTRTFRSKLFPAQESDGKISLIGIISVDVSETVDTRSRLTHSEAVYRRVTEATSFGFWLVDRNGVIQEANAAYAEMSGYSTEELAGMHISDIDTVDQPSTVKRRIEQILESGAAVFEAEHRRKDGRVVPVAVRANLLYPDSEIYFAIIEDITARREAEQSERRLLEQRELMLREGHHRIKNDMQSVRGLLRLHAAQADDRRVTSALEDAAGRIEVITRLYDAIYRRPESGGLQDILPTISGIATDIRARFGDEAPPIVCRGETLHVGRTASVLIAIIVNELLTNAVKYAFTDDNSGSDADASPLVTVEIARPAANSGTVSVADNGAGYPPSVIEGASAGFGLSILHQLAAQLGGTVSISNDPSDGGARSVLQFPLG